MDNIKDMIRMMVKGLFNPNNKLSLIPNWLSASRALCGLIIPILVYSNVSFEIILGTVFYAAISDFLDGKTARLVAKEETYEGAMLDAISDKIFAVLLMVFLIPLVNTIAINLALEATISVINAKTLANGKTPKSNLIGKIKTWPLFISLGFSYLGLSLSNLGVDANLIMGIASTLSLASIPLEIISAKKYLENYRETIIKENNIELTNENDIQINEENTKAINKTEKRFELDNEKDFELDEEKELDKVKNYELDKDKNVKLMVFEQESIKKETLEENKQKKIEF